MVCTFFVRLTEWVIEKMRDWTCTHVRATFVWIVQKNKRFFLYSIVTQNLTCNHSCSKQVKCFFLLCVCVFVFVCVYFIICAYVLIYTYFCMHRYTCIHTYMHLWTHIPTCDCVEVSVCCHSNITITTPGNLSIT